METSTWCSVAHAVFQGTQVFLEMWISALLWEREGIEPMGVAAGISWSYMPELKPFKSLVYCWSS